MPFYEVVEEQIDGFVLQSSLRIATAEDIAEAQKLHREGKCPHTIIEDSYGYLYDIRRCWTCGKGLGTV